MTDIAAHDFEQVTRLEGGYVHIGWADDEWVCRRDCPHPSHERSRNEGFVRGKLGWGAETSLFAPSDRSVDAIAWRKGWTLGHAIHARAMQGESDA